MQTTKEGLVGFVVHVSAWPQAEGKKDFIFQVHARPAAPKPVIGTWNSYKTDEPGFQRLVESGVPVFRSFRNCFAAMRAYADYQEWRKTRRTRPSPRASIAR